MKKNYIQKRRYRNIYDKYKKGIYTYIDHKKKINPFYALLDDYLNYKKHLCNVWRCKSYFDKDHDIICGYVHNINNNKIPDEISDNLINGLYDLNNNLDKTLKINLSAAKYYFREFTILTQGYVLLSNIFIHDLSNYLKGKRVLEIMSGCGSLSYFLEKNGIKCITTDDDSWKGRWYKIWKQSIKMDCKDAIKKYGNEVDYVIMSWPCMDENAYECLIAMKEVSPKLKMIYIGEARGGCTADDRFFDEIDNNYEINKLDLRFKSHYGINDEVYEIAQK